MFIQIHTLTSYHASLLNRDDAGLAKRIPFGDAERTRVSSQCLKRHWRLALQGELELPRAMRSRHFFDRIVFPRIKEAGVEGALAQELTEALIAEVMQSKDAREKGVLALKQPVLFGQPEADYLVEVAVAAAGAGEGAVEDLKQRCKGLKGNLKAMKAAAGGTALYAGIEGALFGRFVTSDILSRMDASVHVAHAFTVHANSTEVDYFSVVDDLKLAGEDAGAAHVGDMELGAGIFYGYVVVDVPLLVSNISGCAPGEWREQDDGLADASKVIEALARAVATVSPGAKLGPTAPYAYTDYMLLEAGTAQPRSLANAFLHAVPLKGDPMAQALAGLDRYLGSVDAMYGSAGSRFVASTRREIGTPDARRGNLAESISGVLEAVLGPR